ncbi:hypothetical protein BH10BAC4_BH10BAC4_13360 [soil metagenome]
MADIVKREIYLFPGLGADERVFRFLDLTPHNLTYVRWIDPEKNEAIEDYARRLLTQITSNDPTLLGVSFGGIMAIEVAKLIPTRKIILISSVRTKADIPLSFRLSSKLGLINLVPVSWLKKVSNATFWSFGLETDSERELLTSIIHETDPKFLKWAIEKIASWTSETLPGNVTLIQGTNDRIFPNSHPDIKIENGGHFMIVNKARELSVIILELLR